eukprot:8982226-Pyramimonas_sp.AAC.1
MTFFRQRAACPTKPLSERQDGLRELVSDSLLGGPHTHSQVIHPGAERHPLETMVEAAQDIAKECPGQKTALPGTLQNRSMRRSKPGAPE